MDTRSAVDIHHSGSQTTWQPGTSAPLAGGRSHSGQGPAWQGSSPCPRWACTRHLSPRAALWEPTLEGMLLSFPEQDLCEPRKGACEDKDRQQLAPKRD